MSKTVQWLFTAIFRIDCSKTPYVLLNHPSHLKKKEAPLAKTIQIQAPHCPFAAISASVDALSFAPSAFNPFLYCTKKNPATAITTTDNT